MNACRNMPFSCFSAEELFTVWAFNAFGKFLRLHNDRLRYWMVNWNTLILVLSYIPAYKSFLFSLEFCFVRIGLEQKIYWRIRSVYCLWASSEMSLINSWRSVTVIKIYMGGKILGNTCIVFILHRLSWCLETSFPL